MNCYGIVPSALATRFNPAAWLTLASGDVLLMQDADYSTFCSAVVAAGGTNLPMFYDPSALTPAQIAAVAPISLAPGATMLELASAAAALNPLLSL